MFDQIDQALAYALDAVLNAFDQVFPVGLFR